MVDIPKSMHGRLRRRAEQAGVPIPTLIVRAVEQAYGKPKRRVYVTGPLVTGRGKLGRLFPVDSSPHEFVFS